MLFPEEGLKGRGSRPANGSFFSKYMELVRTSTISLFGPILLRVILDYTAWWDQTKVAQTVTFAAGGNNTGGCLDFSLIAPLFTASIFVVSSMLNGVISDFKESEKIPAAISTSIEAFEDGMVLMSTWHGDEEHIYKVRRSLLQFVDAVIYMFAFFSPASDALRGGRQPMMADRAFELLSAFPQLICSEKAQVITPYTQRYMGEISTLRGLIARAEVVHETTFLPIGHALTQLCYLVVVLIVTTCRYANMFTAYVSVFALPTIYLYAVRLITDVDDPFKRVLLGEKRVSALIFKVGVAKVDLAPLAFYRARLSARMRPSDLLAEGTPVTPPPATVAMAATRPATLTVA